MLDFSKKKILVIGDIILDKYVEGSVSRISPEAPIPILDRKNTFYSLGGAANVAKNLKALGAMVWIIGRIGDDLAGNIVIKQLSKENIYFDFLMRDKTVPTTVKTRFISSNHQLLRVDLEDTQSVEFGEFGEDLIADIDRHMRNFDAVIISDYNKGVIFPKLLSEISCLKKQSTTIVTADTKKTDISLFRGFDALTPNKIELCKMFGKTLNSLDEIRKAAYSLADTFDINNMVVTLSEEGILIQNSLSSNCYCHIPAETKEVIDVTGAGDTVISVYTLALTCGYTPYDAAILANKAAGIVVTKQGTATISVKDLIDGEV